jgi:hypothetical protein
MARLRDRNDWKFLGVLFAADRTLATAWWVVLVLRGILPALFAIAMGLLVGAIERGEAIGGPLAVVSVAFVLLQVLSPIHLRSARTSAARPRPGSTTG